MKKLFLSIVALFAFLPMIAQTDSKTTPAKEMPAVVSPQMDSTSTNKQIKKETELETMDAVKTQDHVKVTTKTKTTKDTVATAPKGKGTGKKAKS